MRRCFPLPHDVFSTDSRSRPAYENERWLYGYHLKVRHIRQIAQKLGLPWDEDPISCTFRVQRHIILSCNFDFGWKPVLYRDRIARIITFIEDDGRKRLELNRLSRKEMKNVRRVIGVSKGTKPKWYNSVDVYDDDAEFSSEDEEFPEVKDWAIDLPVTCLSRVMTMTRTTRRTTRRLGLLQEDSSLLILARMMIVRAATLM